MNASIGTDVDSVEYIFVVSLRAVEHEAFRVCGSVVVRLTVVTVGGDFASILVVQVDTSA